METVDYSTMSYSEIRKHQNGLIATLSYLLPDSKKGSAELRSFTVDKATVEFTKLKAAMSGLSSEYLGFKPGKYARLLIHGSTIMSNTYMEIETNRSIMDNANGKVLIAGLGIGMIILPIQEKKNVDKIIVVENNEDVIDLVANKLPLHHKVEIVKGNIFDLSLSKDDKFDTIYFDIWDGICADYWNEMKKLTSKFKYKVNRENKNHMLTSWRKEDMKRLYYEEQNTGWI